MERLRFSDWKEARVWERGIRVRAIDSCSYWWWCRWRWFFPMDKNEPIAISTIFSTSISLHWNDNCRYWALHQKKSSVHRSVDIFEVQFKTGWIRSCVHNNVKNAYLSLRIENKITCVKHRHGLRTSSTSGTTPTVINFQYIFFASSLPQMKWNILSVNNSYSLGLFSLSLSPFQMILHTQWHTAHTHTHLWWLTDWIRNGRTEDDEQICIKWNRTA